MSSTCCGCSRAGYSMGRVWGAMASARLILLLLIATTFWKFAAAPWRAPGADDYTGSVNAVAWSDSAFVPEVEPRDVSGGEWDAESQPAPRMEAIADGMGPARQRGKLGRERDSLRFYHALKAVTEDNEVPEFNGEPVDGAVFEEGSSHTLPISREGTEDVQVAGASGAHSEQAGNGVHVNDLPMFCLKGAIAVFVPILLIIIVCCIYIRRRRKKHQRLTEAAKARCAAYEDSEYADRQTWHQRPPRVSGRSARGLQSPNTSPPPRPKSAPSRLPPPRPPRPRSPQPRWAPPPPPPPPPSFRGW
ncbi:uncharacterized protein LOC101750811 isoform X2 [Gallus gallus]|uniref:uncharacterized protein LOC101750811 isoform X2 n=1 Tax=Gallus gallus TaxID=9031 RepID=UPI000739AE56|nr:uncharacterized protein LOC101750811 isoform X2 [Gallus gallus]XP_040545496.1 uncharacterized protein LOC101750811 isoform X2 [Gallus gallus]|eukprot:XP_015152834.1 uncharacterized protein LOC101750811 isoform X2 [Gallus gallus]